MSSVPMNNETVVATNQRSETDSGGGPDTTDGPDPEVQLAFNQGCQARIDGLPLSANPVRQMSGTDRHSNARRDAWFRGFWDVDRYWAMETRGRWPVRALPEVAGKWGGWK